MRDRFIELMRQAEFAYLDFSKMHPCEKSLTDFTADYLLANGVIVPPCKVGDKVYVLAQRYRMPRGIYEGNVKNLIVTDEKIFITTKIWNGAEITTPASEVFCDKEEAEQALKGGAE